MKSHEILIGGMTGEELGASPFYFDEYTQKFYIGGNYVELIDYPNSQLPMQGKRVSETDALLLTHVGHFGLTKLFEFLQTPQRVDQIRQGVVDLMVDVYESIKGIDLGKISRQPDSLFGFNLNLLRPGHISLNVIGNCACYGVDPSSHFLEEIDMDYGLMHFAEHNIDDEAQRTALHAGLGHLAKLAAEA